VYVVVGLGNPGKEYAATRHNIGFLFLDYLAEKCRFTFKGTKWQAETAKDLSWGYPVLFVKPQTYMNRSGVAVRAITDFYQVEASKIIVIHDDLDLPLGRIKIMTNRGAGGHNGIRSLIEHLGGNDFVRVRVGIGRPDKAAQVSDFVLSRFGQEEAPMVLEEFHSIETGVRLVMEEGLSVAMNRINPDHL
jgi:PTH1 family peptidyl-tRNA hydrolase